MLNVNPLEQLPFGDEIAGVMADGNWFSRAVLDEMLETLLADD